MNDTAANYRACHVNSLPFRWMAPEAIEQMVFNEKTDVWSFGVMVWEIFNQAKQPYKNMAHENILSFLKEGNRLPITNESPDTIKDLITKCWFNEPTNRPSFVELEENLVSLRLTYPDEMVEHCESADDDGYFVPVD